MRTKILLSFALLLTSVPAAFAGTQGFPAVQTTRDTVEIPLQKGAPYTYDKKAIESYKNLALEEASKPKIVEPMTLGTPTSIEIGGQFSRYEYEEQDVGTTDTVDVYIRGLKYGIDGRAAYNFGNNFYAMLEARFALGDDDYKGSGKLNGVADDLAEGRLTAGYDFLSSRVGFTPYVGVGFRDLFNDMRGTSTTGALGYKRENQTLYMPVGFTQRTRIDNDSRISFNFEYDQFLWGRQYSDLNDVNNMLPELENHQTWGYGLRGELMYERRQWGLGPFFNYWNINQSEDGCSSNVTAGYLVTACGVEPHNSTLEYGIRFRYRIM